MMSRANMGRQIMTAPASMARSVPAMKKGGTVPKMAKGGMARGDGCCMKGKTKGKMC
jgi:hypothetical protein